MSKATVVRLVVFVLLVAVVSVMFLQVVPKQSASGSSDDPEFAGYDMKHIMATAYGALFAYNDGNYTVTVELTTQAIKAIEDVSPNPEGKIRELLADLYLLRGKAELKLAGQEAPAPTDQMQSGA